MPAAIDLTGRRFDRLTVLGFHSIKGKKRQWKCACDCGRETVVSGSNLGTCIKSCGCLKLEIAKTQKSNRRHGMKGTREYRAWADMKSRCRNPNMPAYRNYGGRGISVCDRWQAFANFLADMGRCPDGLELDRIDNNGNYEPGNCRWTTRSTNIKNTRPRARTPLGTFARSADDVMEALA